MLSDVGVFCTLNNINSSQTFWSQDPFIFLKSMENPKELSFMWVTSIDIYDIRN